MTRTRDPVKIEAAKAKRRAKYHALNPEEKKALNAATNARNAKRRENDPEYVIKKKQWSNARYARINADPELYKTHREQQNFYTKRARDTPEGKKSHIASSTKWAKENPEKRKIINANHASRLPDSYVANIILRQAGDLSKNDGFLILPEEIELKRLVITLKRELKKQKHDTIPTTPG